MAKLGQYTDRRHDDQRIANWPEKKSWLLSVGIDFETMRRYDLSRPMDELCWLAQVREILRNENRGRRKVKVDTHATSRGSAKQTPDRRRSQANRHQQID